MIPPQGRMHLPHTLQEQENDLEFCISAAFDEKGDGDKTTNLETSPYAIDHLQ